MLWLSYKEKIKQISEKIVLAQAPIRILDAIKWDSSVETRFFSKKGKELPQVDESYYSKIPLGFDPIKKEEELNSILRDIDQAFGPDDHVKPLLHEITQQYINVVKLLESRGTPEFSKYSRVLYGSSNDAFYNGKLRIIDLGQMLYSILGSSDFRSNDQDYPKIHPASAVVDELNKRFKAYFHEQQVVAVLSDGIVADAAAGGSQVKIRDGALFSDRDIDILEVHEGWVHIGTFQNGQKQHIAKWLSKGPPRTTGTQEGLAVMMEIFTFKTYPLRARNLNDRLLGIHKAEEGANFLELFEFYRCEGYSESECFKNAKRVCRGGTVDGGAPFTKDISYCRGYVENYNFIRSAISEGHSYLIPFLFVGKLHVSDIPLLYRLHKEGIVDAPSVLPGPFQDLNGLNVWMSFSSFLNRLDLSQIQEHYRALFEKHL